MRDLLYRYRMLLLLVVLVALAGISLLAQEPSHRTGRRRGADWSATLLDIAMPLQRAVAAPVTASRNAWRRYLALVDLGAENDRLHARISALADENLQLREALIASGRLEAVLATQQEVGLPMLPAAVVGQDSSAWFRSVVVDRGRSHGVLRGMPALTDEGVVGIITAASARAAKAMLLTDRQSALDGVVQRSRTRGIVRGLGSDVLRLEYDAREPAVEVGDVVITSGIGGVYPKGLRIGEISAVDPPGRGLLQGATLRPAVDFTKLEQLYVMLWRSPALELLYEIEDEAATAAPSVSAKGER
jgi:rod shape-determining protein MreC